MNSLPVYGTRISLIPLFFKTVERSRASGGMDQKQELQSA